MDSAAITNTYDDMIFALDCEQKPAFPAEFHGYICGIICGGKYSKNEAGFRLVLDMLEEEKLLTDATKQVAAQLMLDSFHHLQDINCDFNLLLPLDDQPITIRSEALSIWCHGFLLGLGMSGADQQGLQEHNVLEALQDIAEISHLEYDVKTPDNDTDTANLSAKEQESAELAFMELTEYVRVAVMMIYTENVTALSSAVTRGQQNITNNELLH